MAERKASAQAHPNIAFIKYWGNRNDELRLPSNGSISMNLDGLHSTTSVHFDSVLKGDQLTLDGIEQREESLARVSQFLSIVRKMSGEKSFAKVDSYNNFAIGSGIASSASAFAALALASSNAAGLELDERDLSLLARRGSGSASRSIPGGFVEWFASDNDKESYSESIASKDHWDLVDLIAIVDERHKRVGSSEGHTIAASSPLQKARVGGSDERLEIMRQSILEKNFSQFSEIVELDSQLMHSVMMTSNPALFYWQPGTLEVLLESSKWKLDGLEMGSTIDAGPNVHVICQAKDKKAILLKLSRLKAVKKVIEAKTGGAVKLLN
jgi:diphosphomevalonate decarboxylase